MTEDYKDNNSNSQQYLIGSKPETIKADIMNFKEEVLVDFKELSKKLEQKYYKINKELKDNMELFNNKISNFNLKLLELNSKIVTDITTKEKLSELIKFKEKAENIMNSNQIKLSMISDDSHYKINQIEDILRNSLYFPRLIGAQSKYKSFPELIEYLFNQTNSLISFKEKNLIEFELYKKKIEHMFNTMKIKIDKAQRETNYNCVENIRKSEEKLSGEIQIRDEKLKNNRVETMDNFNKLDIKITNLNDKVELLSAIKEEINQKINGIENKSSEDQNNIFENFNYIEKKINNLKTNLEESFSYLNKFGANLKIIKDDETKNFKSSLKEKNEFQSSKSYNFYKHNSFNSFENDDKETNELNKNNLTERNFKKSKYNLNNNENNSEGNILNDPLKKRVKSSKYGESDITKYVKGEITADEIGLSTNRRRKKIKTIMNQFQEHLIDKKEYQKSDLTSKQNYDKNEKIITRKINNDEEMFKDDFYINNINNFGNRKPLNKEKKISEALNPFKYLMQYNFNDIDVKLNSNGISADFDSKSSRNNNTYNNFMAQLNKENNYLNKNALFGMNFTKINPQKSTLDIKKKLLLKNMNIIPNNKILTLKNFDRELSAFNFFNKYKNNKNNLLFPTVQKINKNIINIENNHNFVKSDNNVHLQPKLSLSKIKKKLLNFEYDTTKNSNINEINSNLTYNSDRIKYTK